MKMKLFFIFISLSLVSTAAPGGEVGGGGADISGSCSLQSQWVADVSACFTIENQSLVVSQILPASLASVDPGRRIVPALANESSVAYLRRITSALPTETRLALESRFRHFPILGSSSTPPWASTVVIKPQNPGCLKLPAIRRVERVCSRIENAGEFISLVTETRETVFVIEPMIEGALTTEALSALQLEIALKLAPETPNTAVSLPEDPLEPDMPPLLPAPNVELLDLMTEPTT